MQNPPPLGTALPKLPKVPAPAGLKVSAAGAAYFTGVKNFATWPWRAIPGPLKGAVLGAGLVAGAYAGAGRINRAANRISNELPNTAEGDRAREYLSGFSQGHGPYQDPYYGMTVPPPSPEM